MSDRVPFGSIVGITAALAAVVGLAFVIQDPSRLESLTNSSGSAESRATEGDIAAPTAALPTSTPSPERTWGADPDQPFAGSPAAAWPDGIAGLAVPSAKAVGTFSAKEVTAALRDARRYVAASRLDPKVLGGANPAALLDLLDPENSGRRDLIADLKHPTAARNPAYVVTRFDPRGTRLHGSVIKLKGTAKLSVRSRDELVVTLDYSVVYAVRKNGSVPPEVTRVLLREQAELSTVHRRDKARTKVWVTNSAAYFAGVECEAADGFVHPTYESDLLRDGPSPTGSPVDPYDTSRPIGGGLCDPVTRV
jgi:hypothetical protein